MKKSSSDYYDQIFESVFKIQNFFDEISIFDENCICRCCKIFTPDNYSFTADEIIGMHLFEIFPTSNENNSEIYRVIKTGSPIIHFKENGVTYKGDKVKGYSSVYPLFHKKKLIGAAVALKFIGSSYKSEYINVQPFSSRRSVGNENYTLDDIITIDPVMLQIKDKIRKVCDTLSSVLIYGETGTGKDLVAQSIHYQSRRAAQPFVALNCSAVPANLLESTLFGTEKGSFTGAVTQKGLFETADGGTLFLDEINSLDFMLQSKLLKAIEEKNIRHVGGRESIRIDVRIIAALNEEPFEAIAAKHLRNDLFYRLNVIYFELPALRHRNDLLYLTDYFIEHYNDVYEKSVQGLSEEAKAVLLSHQWPGNIRELKNVIEGIFAICESDTIELNDIPVYLRRQNAAAGNSYKEKTLEFERNLVLDVLASCATKTEAAKKLGISKQALNYRLATLHIDV